MGIWPATEQERLIPAPHAPLPHVLTTNRLPLTTVYRRLPLIFPLSEINFCLTIEKTGAAAAFVLILQHVDN